MQFSCERTNKALLPRFSKKSFVNSSAALLSALMQNSHHLEPMTIIIFFILSKISKFAKMHF
jgi:hypothetical protein